MASRSFRISLALAFVLTVADTSVAQFPPPPSPSQPAPPAPAITLPQVPDPSPSALTPAQQRAITQLLDAFLGQSTTPAPPQPAPPPSGVPMATPPQMVPPNLPMSGSMPAASPALRFNFKFDSKAAATSLLPAAPTVPAKLPIWTNEDLTKVPELAFGDPVSKSLSNIKSLEATAHILAKANQLNARKTDGFMLAMIEHRADLRGLPFLMGDECRTREEQARTFHLVASSISQNIRVGNAGGGQDMLEGLNAVANQARGQFPRINHEQVDRALVAALTQILMPESATYRKGLAQYLGRVQNADATRALARLAIFSPEDDVRAAAIENLKVRRERDYTDVLFQGFQYPLPAVAKRTAEAFVKLDRQDLIPKLIGVLESPDPRLPVTEKQGGKEVTLVRELVKVNHHRNCALCHAPGNTENMPEGVLTVAVPLPNEPLPKPSQGGYQSSPPPSPDVTVRIDMTYLRQDFSVMMPVADAHPWPEMQRFDFLVRTRLLTATEAQAYEPCCDAEEPGRLSPYHRSALFALRELTGRDAEPTAAAWRKLLKLPRNN